MTVKMSKLTPRQQQLLAGFEIKDNRAVFPGEHIPDWPVVKKVMLALGGEWKKGSKATGGVGGFIFPDDVDAAEMVRLARETGEILDPNQHDFYWTDEELAERVVELAQIERGMRVLEPSAGQGHLARVARLLTPNVLCVELLPKNRERLGQLDFHIADEPDFLRLSPETYPRFDRVVMNPPFSKRADLLHVGHALEFLKPGGRLVSVMSASVKYRDDKLAQSWRRVFDAHQGELEDNPSGSFKAAGTMVNTVTVTLRKVG